MHKRPPCTNMLWYICYILSKVFPTCHHHKIYKDSNIFTKLKCSIFISFNHLWKTNVKREIKPIHDVVNYQGAYFIDLSSNIWRTNPVRLSWRNILALKTRPARKSHLYLLHTELSVALASSARGPVTCVVTVCCSKYSCVQIHT